MRPTQQPRSGVVTTAAVSLAALAAVVLADLAAALSIQDTLRGRPVTAMTLVAQIGGGPAHVAPAGVGFTVVLVAVELALAWFVLRGNRSARTTAMLLGGLGPVCFVLGEVEGNMAVAANAEPQWYLEFQGFATLLILILEVLVLALLALPQARRHFAAKAA